MPVIRSSAVVGRAAVAAAVPSIQVDEPSVCTSTRTRSAPFGSVTSPAERPVSRKLFQNPASSSVIVTWCVAAVAAPWVAVRVTATGAVRSRSRSVPGAMDLAAVTPRTPVVSVTDAVFAANGRDWSPVGNSTGS